MQSYFLKFCVSAKCISPYVSILLTKATVPQKEDALSYHRVRGQHFVAVVFVRSIIVMPICRKAYFLLIAIVISKYDEKHNLILFTTFKLIYLK